MVSSAAWVDGHVSFLNFKIDANPADAAAAAGSRPSLFNAITTPDGQMYGNVGGKPEPMTVKEEPYPKPQGGSSGPTGGS